MKNETISIIIPVYNVESYLERCIFSVTQQTYQNLEIICVDDGSTDHSGSLLDHFAAQDDRIKVIHKQNQGVASARNTALRIASGSLIGFVDSDDYVAPDYYAKLIMAFENPKVDIATCGYFKDNDGNVNAVKNRRTVPVSPLSMKDFFPYMYERDHYLGVASYLWTRLIRRDLIYNNDQSLRFSFQPYACNEDILFIAELSTRCRQIQYIDEPLYYYVQRNSSITHNAASLVKSMDIPVVYEKILKLYENYGIEEDSLDFIRRLYARRCGQLLETAIQLRDSEKIQILQQKIKSVFPAYVKTNMEHLERIQWLLDLLIMACTSSTILGDDNASG